jgi:hypothetical protein
MPRAMDVSRAHEVAYWQLPITLHATLDTPAAPRLQLRLLGSQGTLSALPLTRAKEEGN